MYESLAKDFNSIVISGPQRSGTRIAAKCVAEDSIKKYIDEKDINFHDFRLLEYYLNKGNCVVQCPALCHMLHYIDNPKVLVIVVIRDVEEILLSESRIGWPKESRLQELYKYGHAEGVISRIKYDFWKQYQAPILKERARTIDYNYLKNHRLFIDKDKRKSFGWDQTSEKG